MFPLVGSLQAKSKRNLLENLNGFGAQFIESKIDGLEGFERWPAMAHHTGCLDPRKILSTIDAPPGVPGVSKNHIFFLQMKLFSLCAKIASKRHKL